MLHDPSAWARINPYLDQALDLEPGERATWLNELERTQADVAETLRSLLGQLESLNASGYLESSLPFTRLDTLLPVLEQMVRQRVGVESGDWLQDSPGFAQSIATEHRQEGITEGAVLGAYRLIREIGHGGMSSVWLAERVDGQLKREVALKVPFAGPQRAQMAKRFKREQDILATLTHPNIATLYDAGVSASGQSYLAMEYVRGTVLTRYCDAGRLSLRERLQHFLQVLAAVGFAHTQLVLHRDLKPSNILVTEQGRVVLLDFGIAKLLSQEVTPESPLTEMAERMLTPDYAAPEHIAGRTLGTTSDVYSLGVVLCELLAGSRPFGSQLESRRDVEEAILTQDPPRPSQLPLTEAIAAARHTTPRKLAQMLKGDLDTIVLKALKKAPAERYRSVDAFAQDIANYLGHLPVSARPDSTWYRFGRFASRYKLQVTAATVTLLAIIGGGAAALWQARVAAQERDRAVALASSNASINEFMTMLVSEAASAEKPVTVSEMLERSVKLALAGTGDSNENRAAILGTVAGLYDTSGDSGKSAHLFEQALAMVGNSSDGALRTHLTCLHAAMIAETGQVDAAVSAITRELENVKLDHQNASECLRLLSLIAERTGDTQGALRNATLALEHFRQTKTKNLTEEGTLLGRVATGHRLQGDNAQANRYFELALRKYAEAGRAESPETMILMNNWAIVTGAAGEQKRSLELYDRLLGIAAERDPGAQPPAALVHNRARALELIGRFAAARSAFELGRQLSIQSKSINFHAFCLLGLASVAQQSGDRIVAARYLAEVTELVGPSQPADHPTLTRRAVIQGALDLAEGRPDAARAGFEWVLSKKRKNPTAVSAALGKAEAELLAGDVAAAVTEAQAALDMATSLQGGIPYSNYTGLSWLMLGRALLARGETQQARKAFEAAVSHLSNTVDADHPELLRARQLLAPAH
jgi:serine/threonine-protein kinase